MPFSGNQQIAVQEFARSNHETTEDAFLDLVQEKEYWNYIISRSQ
jgi:hypothetical protein